MASNLIILYEIYSETEFIFGICQKADETKSNRFCEKTFNRLIRVSVACSLLEFGLTLTKLLLNTKQR